MATTYAIAVETQAMNPRHGATIKGMVTFPGTIPIKVETVPGNVNFCGKKPIDPGLSVKQDTRGVKNVIVYIDQINHPVEVDTEHHLVVRNKDCAFQTRVGTLTVGQRMEIVNDDPIMHNTHVRNEKKTILNVGLLPGIRPISKEVRNPGILTIQCAIHEFMEGFVGVFPHPYHSQTDEGGEFRIESVPPGEYELVIWHELLGTLRKILIVEPHEHDVVINFDFPLPMTQDRQPIILTQ